MNRQRKDKRKEVVDTSNLMLLAEVCCEEIERITLEKKKESERIAPNLMLLAEVSCQELERITLEKEKETEKIGRPRRLFPSHSKNNDHKKARAIPLPLPSTNENAKSVASKPCSSRMAATKGAHDNQQRQQFLPVRNNNNAVVERPRTTPSWVEQWACTQLHRSQPPVWMFGKPLTMSDTLRQQNRLFFPRSCLEDKLFPQLTTEEKEMLEIGISVMGLDENGRIWDLSLIHWTSINQHLFKRDWVDLVEANNFQEGEIIHVWLGRHGNEEEQNQGKLCFLIGRLSAQPR